MRRKPRALEPRKPPIQRRSRQTVEELLQAAAQVFEELGYAAATTNRIADRAGVSIGTLYQYFPNRDGFCRNRFVKIGRGNGKTDCQIRRRFGNFQTTRHVYKDIAVI